MNVLKIVAALCVGFFGCEAAELKVLSEFLRFSPMAEILETDRTSGSAPSRSVTLDGARGGFVSCQIAASLPAPGTYEFTIDPFPADSGLQVDVYREWFHLVSGTKRYYPDALIPVRPPYRGAVPDPDNQVPGQTAHAFWVDIWIPAGARPGEYETRARLQSGGAETLLPIRVRVNAAVIPSDDAVVVDHNSYGTSWFASQYPKLVAATGPAFYRSDRLYDLIHQYHRMFYEHRGVFHQLGYGHAGKVGPEFAPELAGSGKTKHVVDWTAYDRHYGPLFDGSAFASTRRGARPIPYAYLPINPEWPASFLWWGEPGYEREFINVVSEMERHFREKGWVSTRLELFFNHKKRHKGFPWDGDETRFARDDSYLKEYVRLMKLAVPADSPVKFVSRADVSWTMERQFRELAGVVNLWVCGAGMFSWYRDSLPVLKKRGDIVWTYGGTPPMMSALSHITMDPLRAWVMGVDGFVRWQTTQPGADPWFRSDGGGEALVYPGDRFGIAGPIPSVRLKVERNALQDIALLNSLGSRAEAARRFNNTTVDEWWTPRPPLADTNPEDWSNATIGDAEVRSPKFTNIDVLAWDRVRQYVIELQRKVR